MQQCSTTDIKSTYATANSNPSLLTAETGNSEVDITNTAAVSSPAVFQLDLSKANTIHHVFSNNVFSFSHSLRYGRGQ